MKQKRTDVHQDGFTLLETLVALIMLAVATTMFAKSVSVASAQLSGADRLTDASFLGAKLMAETNAQSLGVVEGLDEATRLNWRRLVVTEGLQSDNEPSPVLLVTLEIFRSIGEPPLLQLRSAIVIPVLP